MIRKNTLSLVTTLTLLLAASGSVWGTDLYWSGTGTWDDGITTNWGVAPGGPYNVSAWVGGANAIFEGTAGTVSVSGTIASVGSITFTTDGYTLQTGSLTLTGAGGNITTGAGANTISTVIGGTAVTKLGSGTLTLGGANTFTTGLTIKAGTVIASTSVFALGAGGVTLGDSAGGNNAAALLIGATGLTYGNPLMLAANTTGLLTLGNTRHRHLDHLQRRSDGRQQPHHQ